MMDGMVLFEDSVAQSCPHENLSAFSSEYIISDEVIGLMRGDQIFHEPVHIV